ncbi:DUF3696 domain-containing protein [Candidatus Poriferisodalis sp.]|uniref:AAA family ATPase n=1 Tax=Candidatus Poriferisodalis sp. TaxID=3101277 RepID=UPI003B594CC1
MRLQNFKSWADTGELKLAPATGFFGANSSGKSSLLHAFVLMKQTAQSNDISSALNLGDKGRIIDFGNYTQILHDGIFNQLEMMFAWNMPSYTVALSQFIRSETRELDALSAVAQSAVLQGDIQFEFRMPLLGEHVENLTYRTGPARIEYSDTGDHSLPESHRYQLKMVADESSPPDEYMEDNLTELPPPAKCYGFGGDVRSATHTSPFLRALERDFEIRFFDRLFYLGPLRQRAERTYLWRQHAPADVGTDGSNAVQALLAARDRGKTNSRQPVDGEGFVDRINVEEHVAQWLHELQLASVFETRRLRDDYYEVLIRAAPNSRQIPLVDVGFGVSQVLPVLVLLAYVPEGTTVLLEQPEMHLHPASQSALADVLLEAAKVRNLQVIVESHSEHLLTRLQRRVAEETASNDDVALYFCEHDGHESQITPLEVNGLGEIENWPPDFFGDAMGEAVAMVEARAHRAD